MIISDEAIEAGWRSIGALALVDADGRTICSDCLSVAEKRQAEVHRLIRTENFLDFPIEYFYCSRCGRSIFVGRLEAAAERLSRRLNRLESKLPS